MATSKENRILRCPHCGKSINLKCKRCGYEWIPRTSQLPKVCPNRKCKSPYWDRDRIRKLKKNKAK